MAPKEKEDRKEPNSLPKSEESCFLNEYVFYHPRLVIEAFVAFSPVKKVDSLKVN